MSSNKESGSFLDKHFENLPVRRSKEALLKFSREIIPVITPFGVSKFENFIEPIIDRSAQRSRWLMKKRIEGTPVEPEEIERDMVFFVGLPGSGKTRALQLFNERLSSAKVRNLNVFSWEDADIDHISNKATKRYSARPLSSDITMQEANKRALEIFNSRNNWEIATGEYAPFGRKDPQTGKWDGRDAGATFLESIVEANNRQEVKSNIHIVGLCSDSGLDWLVNPNRNQGAYMNQVMLYRAQAVELTRAARTELDLPDYLDDYLARVNTNPLLYPEFKSKFTSRALETANYMLPVEEQRFFEEKNIGRLIQENPDLKQFWPLSEFEKKPLFENCLLRVARNNCESIAPLYLMNHFFTQLGIPQDQIYMGMNAPSLAGYQEGGINLVEYLTSVYSASGLTDSD